VSFENRKELLHDVIFLVFDAEFSSGHAFGLLESLELNVGGGDGLVGDGSSDLIQIVSSHRSELASTADVLMELILEVDERVVRS